MLWLFPLFILLLDIVTKWLTVQYLPHMCTAPCVYPYGGIAIFSNFLGVEFSLSHMTNRGAAWGLFGDHQELLLIFRAIVILFLIGYLLFRSPPLKVKIGLFLVVAGGIGNILDYFIYGHVIDMFHFVLWGYDFPIFNVADISIFLGVVWLIGIFSL